MSADAGRTSRESSMVRPRNTKPAIAMSASGTMMCSRAYAAAGLARIAARLNWRRRLRIGRTVWELKQPLRGPADVAEVVQCLSARNQRLEHIARVDRPVGEQHPRGAVIEQLGARQAREHRLQL